MLIPVFDNWASFVVQDGDKEEVLELQVPSCC
jgi:hypothetical protein